MLSCVLRLTTFMVLVSACIGLLAGCDASGEDDKPRTGRVFVSAQSNIFIAGAQEVPQLPGGGGQLPEVVSVQNGGFVEFPRIEGTITQNPDLYDYVGADGGTTVGSQFNPYGWISGLQHSSRAMFLVGVFLGDNAPLAPPPESLHLDGMNDMAEVRDLKIGQIFFIGDGRTANGAIQRFFVPPGATRLFLGFPDHPTDNFDPGYYADNDGLLEVRYAVHRP